MARQAEADGIELVCATPHIRSDHQVRIPLLAGRVAELNEEFARNGLTVKLVAGGEVAEPMLGSLTEDEFKHVALGGGGRWVLVEPAAGALSSSLVGKVSWLRRVGYRSLIAHPERHFHAGAPAVLARLVDEGALVQVTAAELAREQPGAVHELAERGLVHVVGSDSHSSHAGRPVRLSDAFAPLAELKIVAPHLEWIFRTAPAAIVRGEELEPPFRWAQAA
jgi:tyrosine-protein phosphatase YwqE